MLTLQILKIMDNIWQSDGLDLRLVFAIAGQDNAVKVASFPAILSVMGGHLELWQLPLYCNGAQSKSL